MNRKMRHTVHLLLGEELTTIAPLLKQYSLMYGEGDAMNYLQIVSCSGTGAEAPLTLRAHIHEKPQKETSFSSGLENRYRVGKDYEEELTCAADLQQYFTALFNRSVTIEDPGADGSLNVCLYLPLYDRELWEVAKRIVEAIKASARRMQVDVLGLPAEMSLLLCTDDQKRKELPSQLISLKKITGEVCREIIAHEDIHRLLLFEDCNSEGLALNLDRDGLIRICGEFALLYVEHYEVLYPATQMGDKIDVTSFGLSLLAFDKVYFVHYLLRKSYLHILERELGDEHEKINVNHAAEVTQEILEKHVNLFNDFMQEEVAPVLAQHNKKQDLNLSDTQMLEAKLQQRMDLAIVDMQKFISDPKLSLIEKQAIMAQLLGEDDPLLDGVQYFKDQLVIDDCDAETLNYFIEEDNKMVSVKKTPEVVMPTDDVVEEEETHGVLSAPLREDGKVFLPLKEIKRLRVLIKQRTAFIRKKMQELESLDQQMDGGKKIVKHLTDDGFQFGEEVFRLLPSDQEARLFEETYVPCETKERNVDLSENFTRVKTQGKLGACTAFALVSIFEYLIKKANPSNPDLSERFAYYNAVKSITPEGMPLIDTGSTFYSIIESLSKDGVASEALCPYTQTLDKPSEEAYADGKTRLVKIAKNVNISHKDITSALAQGYPVAISLKLFDSFETDSHGFVYRPSQEEIARDEAGYHAMVICGYSEDDKVYKVRNSWGTDFGDRGYCYIPFSYIDDPDLTNQACIITDIALEKEVKVVGQDKRRTVSFNMTDDGIRASILRILIDEENVELEKDERKYAKLRYEYEQLLQTLSNPPKRDAIFENSVAYLKKNIAREREVYKDFVENIRPARLKAFRKESFDLMLSATGVLCAFIVLLVGVWYFGFDTARVVLLITTGVVLLLWVLLFWYRKYKKSMLRKSLEEEAARINSRIAQLETELNEKHLRLHLAGAVISRLTDTKIKLVDKYHALISYIKGLKDWMYEEKNKLGDMVAPNRTPCIQLLKNDVLDAYFEDRKELITRDIHLYELVGKQGMTDEDILLFKLRLRDQLIGLLEAEYLPFSMVEYLTGKTSYPYLSAVMSIKDLMPQMDKRSDCFLHILQTGVSSDESLEKTVFINTDKQTDRNSWRDEFKKYFSQQPCDGELDSRYKLIELQVQNLDADQVALIYSNHR